jgi:heme iron utilization protein
MVEIPANADPSFNPLEDMREIIMSGRMGALATLARNGDPLTTLATYAPLMDGTPIFLFSRLSGHTHNIMGDGRVSFLITITGKGDPLAHPRLTLNGKMMEISDHSSILIARQRFLARHPKAKLYVDFGDFNFWSLEVEDVHYNGGFAKAAQAKWRELYHSDEILNRLAVREREIVETLNDLYLRELQQILSGDDHFTTHKNSKIVSCDPKGIDFLVGDGIRRLHFKTIVSKAEQLSSKIAAVFQII